ncbi:hypothetical protein AAFF_G00418060 [Aldrovandia affinis]|uniref:Uncharacterized protein n=1 Tax=Aldrovandia affinis TaxID=143900 RepID=A0AAD7SAQ4_9TELE|nr:hypothetical protein AAFF_G00418060 [Aldrovandia affinis]
MALSVTLAHKSWGVDCGHWLCPSPQERWAVSSALRRVRLFHPINRGPLRVLICAIDWKGPCISRAARHPTILTANKEQQDVCFSGLGVGGFRRGVGQGRGMTRWGLIWAWSGRSGMGIVGKQTRTAALISAQSFMLENSWGLHHK